MKINKIIYPLAAASLALAACDDQIMEWRPGDPTITGSDIPMELAEKIQQYDFLKNYMAEYHPNVDITLGMTLDKFLDDEAYRQVVLDNYQGVTFGNAMKHQSIVSASGKTNWDKVDQFIAMNSGLKLHGHNLLWHTQQQQTYLKTLIAPKLVQEQTGGSDGIANVLPGDASDFEGGSSGGWSSWGSNKASADVVAGAGVDGSSAMVLVNNGDGNAWEAQFAYTFDAPLLQNVEYKIHFKAKSSSAAGQLQFQYQNGSSYGSQGGYNTFNLGTDWMDCEYTFTITDYDDVNRIILNFGAVGGTYYIDDIRFGEYTEPAKDPMENVLVGDANDFEGGTSGGWGSWGSNKASGEVVEGAGVDGSYAMVLVNNGDGNAWEAQFAYTFEAPLEQGVAYIIQFQAKSDSASGQLQFQYQNGSSYGSQGGYNTFNIGTEWTTCEYEFTIADYDDVNRIILNFGAVGGTYYIDNIKFGKKIEATRSFTRAANFHYEIMPAEQKKEALLTYMESWIKECMEHVGQYCSSWDVINEPISDNGRFRGVEGGWSDGDAEPTETETEGLNLNWANETGNGHFYWGYYCGMDYAVKAFEFAAKYNPNGAKLFVNDYNLETNPGKLAKLIEFVNYIDTHGAHVDGIGTQMHVSSSITKDKVDAMFQTLAATGKLIRITELDITVGTTTPSADQLQAQSDAYQMIITSYFENIPEDQQSAITLWTLSDNEKEHEYWLKDDAPNIFNGSYGRKIAYKGVCDAIAGKDVSADFKSHDYSKHE